MRNTLAPFCCMMDDCLEGGTQCMHHHYHYLHVLDWMNSPASFGGKPFSSWNRPLVMAGNLFQVEIARSFWRESGERGWMIHRFNQIIDEIGIGRHSIEKLLIHHRPCLGHYRRWLQSLFRFWLRRRHIHIGGWILQPTTCCCRRQGTRQQSYYCLDPTTPDLSCVHHPLPHLQTTKRSHHLFLLQTTPSFSWG